MNNNTIYLAVTVAFMIGLAIIGIMISRGVKSSEDWMVAGKSLGKIPMAGTYFATIVSATSIMSYMGYYYLNGWPGWWNAAGTLMTSFLACIYFARKVRQSECNTLPEFIEKRYSRAFSIPASLLVVLCCTALLANQVTGAVILLQSFVDWSTITCCVILLLVFIVFTCIGGMKAVAWTDTVCSLVIIVGVWIIAGEFLFRVGGFTAMNEGIAAVNPEFVQGFSVSIPPMTALSWVITWGICNFGAPQFVARFMSAESPEVASKSQGITGIGLLLFYVPLAIIGLCGILIHPGIEKQDAVFTTLIMSEVTPLMGAVMLAAVVAAIISTADSLLLLVATTFTHDFYCKVKSNVTDKEELLVSRVSTIVFGVGSVVLTFFINDTIQTFQAKAVTLMGSALAVTTMVGVAYKKANKISAMIAAVCGFVTAVIWYALNQPFGIMPALPACAVCFVVIMVASWITPASANDTADKEVMENLFGKQ